MMRVFCKWEILRRPGPDSGGLHRTPNLRFKCHAIAQIQIAWETPSVWVFGNVELTDESDGLSSPVANSTLDLPRAVGIVAGARSSSSGKNEREIRVLSS